MKNPAVSTLSKEVIIYLSSAFGITMLLFFLDEGYYDFRWMASLGNWMAFAVYFSAIFWGQFGLSRIFPKLLPGAGRIAINILGGATLGFLVVIYMIFIYW